jgi:hypothetical protein
LNQLEPEASAFELSRIFGDGWKTAKKLLASGADIDSAAAAVRNPHRTPEKRERWTQGFMEAMQSRAGAYTKPGGNAWRPTPAAATPESDMTKEESFDDSSWPREVDFVAERRTQTDRLYLLDLIRVLRPHAAGLRRWSVMRRIRAHRESTGLPVEQRMEDAVERVFRNNCGDAEKFKRRDSSPESALFYWPQGKLGGIWAVDPNRADAWLKDEGFTL